MIPMSFARILCFLGATLMLPMAWAALPIEHWTQPNGVQVYLVQSHSLPMVDVQIDFDAGSRRDPADKAGLASATAATLSRGIRRNGDLPGMEQRELNEAWADLGAVFGASAGNDRMEFFLRTLTDPDLLARVLALAARQIGEPSFQPAAWARERELRIASLRESYTRPAAVAARAFTAAVYGKHPYGRETTEASLTNITDSDMYALYDRYILPCLAKVSVVGAVTRAQTERLVSSLFVHLDAAHGRKECPVLPPVPEVAPLAQSSAQQSIAFDSAQAHVLIGQPGIRRNDPDFLALTVGNYVLGGGGFVSRLMSQVREKRGLSYSVYSYFAPGLHAGAFTVGLQTRPDQAVQAVALTQEVVAQFVREGPSAQELQAAKNNLIGGFALRFDSNRKLLGNVANIAWNGLALDYLDNWTAQVDRLSAADVKAAFERVLQPQTMVTVVVGGRDKAP